MLSKRNNMFEQNITVMVRQIKKPTLWLLSETKISWIFQSKFGFGLGSDLIRFRAALFQPVRTTVAETDYFIPEPNEVIFWVGTDFRSLTQMIRSDPITVNRSDPVPHVHEISKLRKNRILVYRFKKFWKLKY